jgi:hypothetical protein
MPTLSTDMKNNYFSAVSAYCNHRIHDFYQRARKPHLPFVSLLLICVCLTACETYYQPVSDDGLFGYRDRKVDDSVYTVSFRANSNSDPERVYQYCLFRCAELCLEQHYVYFTVMEDQNLSVVWSGKYAHTDPGFVKVIRLFHESPAMCVTSVYNAAEVYKNLAPIIRRGT